MDPRRLRYFVAVAEELHFGRAAERLHMTQQPLSVQVQRLERELDCRLFDRGANRIALTAAGEVLLVDARRILAQIASATERTRQTARGEAGVLRMGSCAAALQHVVPTTIRVLKERQPALDVRLREMGWSSQQDALLDGELDFGFTYRPTDDRAFVVENLIEDRFVVALPRLHPLAGARMLGPRDLDDVPFVAMTPDQNACARPTTEILRDGERDRPVAYEVADRSSALGLVGTGLGFAVMPGLAASVSADVAYVPLDTARRMWMSAIWSRDAGSTALHERCIETIRSLIARDAFRPMAVSAGR